MAFIPIHIRADIQGSKKGRITPAQQAQLNAWSLSKKTGILDWGGKCTITNTVPERASNGDVTITFNKGYIVICGRLIECEDGTNFTFNTSVNETGKIILKIDLNSSGENEFVIEKTTRSQLTQQDLNENPVTGIYEFELYSYTTTSTNVSFTSSVSSYVKNLDGLVEDIKSNVRSDIEKIEKRLDRLGFKSGRLTPQQQFTNLTGNDDGIITREGNRVVIKFSMTCDIIFLGNVKKILFTVPEWAIPKNYDNLYIGGFTGGNSSGFLQLDKQGQIWALPGFNVGEIKIEKMANIVYEKPAYESYNREFAIGYEAEPIN